MKQGITCMKKASSLLIAEMATVDLSVESAILLLRTLRKEEREIYKTNVQPQLMSDKRYNLNSFVTTHIIIAIG